MKHQRRFRTFIGLITITLLLTALSFPGFGKEMTRKNGMDECEDKKAELKKLEAEVKSLTQRIKNIEKETSLENLLKIPKKEVNEKLENALKKMDFYEENQDDQMGKIYLKFYRNEVDFWMLLLDVNVFDDPKEIVNTEAYGQRKSFVARYKKERQEKLETILTLRTELKKLGCSTVPTGSGNNWNAVLRETETDVFYQYNWKITKTAAGNLKILQTLVDTNNPSYRGLIGNTSEILAKKEREGKFRIDHKEQNSVEAFSRRIECLITEKNVNCTGIHKSNLKRYWFGIRGGKLN